jgi:glucan endo-1,3-beta-D-glucosidase
MHSFARLVASALAVSSAAAVYTGFNYGDRLTDGSIKQQSDYEKEFWTAKNLVGAEGFTSARLYTSIVSGFLRFEG